MARGNIHGGWEELSHDFDDPHGFRIRGSGVEGAARAGAPGLRVGALELESGEPAGVQSDLDEMVADLQEMMIDDDQLTAAHKAMGEVVAAQIKRRAPVWPGKRSEMSLEYGRLSERVTVDPSPEGVIVESPFYARFQHRARYIWQAVDESMEEAQDAFNRVLRGEAPKSLLARAAGGAIGVLYTAYVGPQTAAIGVFTTKAVGTVATRRLVSRTTRRALPRGTRRGEAVTVARRRVRGVKRRAKDLGRSRGFRVAKQAESLLVQLPNLRRLGRPARRAAGEHPEFWTVRIPMNAQTQMFVRSIYEDLSIPTVRAVFIYSPDKHLRKSVAKGFKTSVKTLFKTGRPGKAVAAGAKSTGIQLSSTGPLKKAMTVAKMLDRARARASKAKKSGMTVYDKEWFIRPSKKDLKIEPGTLWMRGRYRGSFAAYAKSEAWLRVRPFLRSVDKEAREKFVSGFVKSRASRRPAATAWEQMTKWSKVVNLDQQADARRAGAIYDFTKQVGIRAWRGKVMGRPGYDLGVGFFKGEGKRYAKRRAVREAFKWYKRTADDAWKYKYRMSMPRKFGETVAETVDRTPPSIGFRKAYDRAVEKTWGELSSVDWRRGLESLRERDIDFAGGARSFLRSADRVRAAATGGTRWFFTSGQQSTPKGWILGRAERAAAYASRKTGLNQRLSRIDQRLLRRLADQGAEHAPVRLEDGIEYLAPSTRPAMHRQAAARLARAAQERNVSPLGSAWSNARRSAFQRARARWVD